jgi:transposase
VDIQYRVLREDVPMPKRKRRSFSPEEKADAVRMVREVGNLAKVARDLELTETSLRAWVKQAEVDDGKGPEGALTTEELEELRRLRREVRTLRMERDFAKKAAAFFAKDLDSPSS